MASYTNQFTPPSSGQQGQQQSHLSNTQPPSNDCGTTAYAPYDDSSHADERQFNGSGHYGNIQASFIQHNAQHGFQDHHGPASDEQSSFGQPGAPSNSQYNSQYQEVPFGSNQPTFDRYDDPHDFQYQNAPIGNEQSAYIGHQHGGPSRSQHQTRSIDSMQSFIEQYYASYDAQNQNGHTVNELSSSSQRSGTQLNSQHQTTPVDNSQGVSGRGDVLYDVEEDQDEHVGSDHSPFSQQYNASINSEHQNTPVSSTHDPFDQYSAPYHPQEQIGPAGHTQASSYQGDDAQTHSGHSAQVPVHTILQQQPAATASSQQSLVPQAAIQQPAGPQAVTQQHPVIQANNTGRRTRYSAAENNTIRTMLRNHATHAQIAQQLGRHPNAIALKVGRMQGRYGDPHAAEKRRRGGGGGGY